MNARRVMIRGTLLIIVIAASFFLALPCVQAIDFAELQVRVAGIRNSKGYLGVALFQSKKGYPTHLEHAYEVKWVELKSAKESLQVVFEGVPAGDSAVSVIHDENMTYKLERSTLGFPLEGVGFSNDQKVKLSAPSFDSCKFPLANGQSKSILITVDYREE